MAETKSLKERQQAKSALERLDLLEKIVIKGDEAKKIPSLIEQVAELQASMPKVLMAVNQGFETYRNQLSHLTETVDAVVGNLGEDEVIAAINANRVKKAIDLATARQASVESAVKNGHIVVEEAIRACDPEALDETTGQLTADDKGQPREIGSFVATLEYDLEGKELPGSYFCMPLAKIKKEFHEKLVGQKIGFEFDTVPALDKDGKTFPAEGSTEEKPLVRYLKRKVVGVYKAVPPKPPEEKPADAAAPAADAAPAAEAAPEAPPAQQQAPQAVDSTPAAPPSSSQG